MPATLPARGTTSRVGCRNQPSGQRSGRLGSPPHRFLDPEGDRAFEDIAFHRQLGVFRAQPLEFGALTFVEPAITALPGAPLPIHPVTQGAATDPQLAGDLRNRFAGLPHDPNRTLFELLVELPPCLHRRTSSWRCLHDMSGMPLLVFTHDQVFDLNRNGTVTHVCNWYGLSEDQVFQAGDTANDIEMLRIYPRAVCVRSFDDEVHGLPEIAHAGAVSQDLARCVREGIDHFFSSRAVPE